MDAPLQGDTGGHTGAAPTISFGWIACGRLIPFWGLRVGGFVCWLVKTVHMNQHHRCCTFVSPGLIERSEIYLG